MHKKQIRPLARLHGYWLCRRVLTPMQAWSRDERQSWIFEKLKRTLVGVKYKDAIDAMYAEP